MKIRTLARKASDLPKRIVALIAIAVLTLPLAAGFVSAAPEVTMEGNTKVLNVTAGETEYKDSTNAKVDEVVQVELWHHNRQMPTGPKAKNTTVKFSLPTQPGKTQVITGTTTSDNGNTITDTATVNLSLDRAQLDYIPGTAMFRYNKGAATGDTSCQTGLNYPPERCYATVKISDDVVKGGVNLDKIRGGPLTGCNAYHETVTVQLRSHASVVSVNKYVRHAGETGSSSWKTSTNAKPGDDLEYMIKFKNEGNTELKSVMVGDNLPKYNSYVAGTTKLQNGAYPNGLAITNDNITKGGINVGNYMPGAVGYVWFKARLDGIQAYAKCGTYDIRNVGVVRPQGMNEYYNTAQVLINVECKPDEKPNPSYSCDLLKVEKLGGREVKYTVSASAKDGASIHRYVYSFGDGTADLVTDKTSVTHTYAKDGTYAAHITVQVKVDDQTKEVTSESCAASVTFTTPPTTPPTTPTTPVTPGKLPSTGPASVVATFFAVTGLSSFAYYIFARRFA